MRRVTAALCAACILASCSCSWLQKQKDPDVALTTIYDVSTAISAAGEQAFRVVCGAVASGCLEAKDETCESLVACQADRESFTKRMAAVQTLLALAKAQNLNGKIEEAKAIEAKAQALLTEAKSVLEKMVSTK